MQVLFVDFMKAFDVLDRSLLLKTLEIYGMSSNSLELMSSFLDQRTQSVLVNGTMPSPLPIECGVPQGSILGPILFSIYINDLPLFLTAICELFVDDTTLGKWRKCVPACQMAFYNAKYLFSISIEGELPCQVYNMIFDTSSKASCL